MTVEWSYVHNKGESFCYFYTILSNGKFCLEDIEIDTVVYSKFKNGTYDLAHGMFNYLRS